MAINSHLNYARGVSDASHENVVQYYEPLRKQSNASHCYKMLFIAFYKRISITNDGFKCRRNTIYSHQSLSFLFPIGKRHPSPS